MKSKAYFHQAKKEEVYVDSFDILEILLYGTQLNNNVTLYQWKHCQYTNRYLLTVLDSFQLFTLLVESNKRSNAVILALLHLSDHSTRRIQTLVRDLHNVCIVFEAD